MRARRDVDERMICDAGIQQLLMQSVRTDRKHEFDLIFAVGESPLIGVSATSFSKTEESYHPHQPAVDIHRRFTAA